MRFVARAELRDGGRRASRRRDAVEGVPLPGRKDDDAFPSPGSSDGRGRVAEDLRRPARRFHLLQFAVREKRQKPAVGRPEGKLRAFRRGERGGGEGVERANPELAPAGGQLRGENDARSIGRDGRGTRPLERGLARRRQREPDRPLGSTLPRKRKRGQDHGCQHSQDGDRPCQTLPAAAPRRRRARADPP